MKTHHGIPALLIIVLISIIAGCDKRFSLEELSSARAPIIIGDTSYVEITPSFDGFNEPRGILIGNDQLLYVADTKNNRLVMMNVAGQTLATRSILHPLCVAQDLKLDLIIGGEVVETNGDTVGAVFRLSLVAAQHDLRNAVLDTIWKEPSRPLRRFVGVAVLPDNRFLVVRRGPNNNSFVDPDSRVLVFNANNVFQTPLPDLVTRAGSGITDINQPSGISTFPNSRDFIILQSSEGVAYGALWMVYQLTADFDGWIPKYDPAKPDQRFVDFVRPNRFITPLGVAIDPRRRDIFITDTALDSVFKFDSRGKFKSESFGLFGTGGRMKKPSGIAFFDRTLYVADAQEGKILRFRLSTDFQ